MRRQAERYAAPRSYVLLNRLLRSRLYRTAYYIQRAILIVKVAIVVAALACILFVKLVIGDADARTLASPSVAAQEAQRELDSVLRAMPRDQVAQRRSACATGDDANAQQDLRDAGFRTASAGAWCVTVLTRAGRDGTLGYLRDPNSNDVSPSFAFDTGFVGGYLKREVLPADAPMMNMLLPLADRCLLQREANAKLCSSVGYMLGLRAARGDTVKLN